MRYFVTVDGGADGLWLSHGAAKKIRENAIANLRRFRVESGYDYVGLEISGESIGYFQDLTLEGIERRVKAKRNSGAGGFLGSTRLIVSPTPVDDSKPLSSLNLVLALEAGDAFSWKASSSNFSSVITVDKEKRSLKINAIVQDLLQDLMVANSDSLQAIIHKIKTHLTEAKLTELAAQAAAPGGAPEAPSPDEVEKHLDTIGEPLFLEAKAKFARLTAAALPNGSLFSAFDPDRYAAFSSLARRDFHLTMDAAAVRALGELWTQFLEKTFSAQFLTTEEAVRLVRTGSFRRTRTERQNGEGQKPKARVRRHDLSERDLTKVIGDKRVVTTSGCYVLCLLNRTTRGEHGDLSMLFGKSSDDALRRLTLCTEQRYQKMIPLVRKGLVTPIRLFLKAV